MTIDWKRFAERVPVGTSIIYTGYLGDRYEGVLLENYPYKSLEYQVLAHSGKKGPLDEKDYLHFQPFDQENRGNLSTPYWEYAKNLEYLVNDQWLTFEEIMR